MTAIATIALRLDPLDVLFFRDGKPFEAGIRASSTEPLPQTLAGALRTQVLGAARCDFAGLGKAVRAGRTFAAALAEQKLGALADLACRGPWFARGEPPSPLLPMPAVLHRLGKQQAGGDFVRLAPMDPVPSWWRDQTLRPLWTVAGERTNPASGWLTLEGMTAFLGGGVPQPKHVVHRADLFEMDSRTGITIGGTWTTEESQIYAADYLALKSGVCLYAEVSGPADVLQAAFPGGRVATLALGGQGRRVRATRLEKPAAWSPPAMRGAKRMLVLTSPGVFAEGWKPRGLDPVAAAVPGHIAFSGWDLARGGPKATRFAAAAGSVFYFDSPPNPSPKSLCDEAEDRLVGWGSYLEGIW
jgi:CRISPR-associated protein Cmr3